MDAKQIIEILDEFDTPGVGYQDMEIHKMIAEKTGHFVVADEYGGEGKGADWWIVLHFTLHNVFVRLNGYYESGSGVEFESYEEVVPKSVTVTKYVTVDEADEIPDRDSYDPDDSDYFNNSEY